MIKFLEIIYYKLYVIQVTKYGKYLIITNIVIFKELIYINTAECGTIEVQNQPSIRLDELINTMDEQELIILGEHFQPNRNHFFNMINGEPANMQQNTNNNKIHWEAITFFVVSSIILYVISQHGHTILNSIFDLCNIPQTLGETINNIIHNAIQQNGIQPVRNILINKAYELLNDPHTANKVVVGLNAIRQHRVGVID